jgi:hypothetical protein
MAAFLQALPYIQIISKNYKLIISAYMFAILTVEEVFYVNVFIIYLCTKFHMSLAAVVHYLSL